MKFRRIVTLFFRLSILLSFNLQALVFLPPRREVESWDNEFTATRLSEKQLTEIIKAASSSSQSSNSKISSSKSSTRVEPKKTVKSPVSYSFNGKDLMSFFIQGGRRAEWEAKLPLIDWNADWGSSEAWTGLSVNESELHHFYLRSTRRGPEPLYKVYTLSKLYDFIDIKICAEKNLVVLMRKKSNLLPIISSSASSSAPEIKREYRILKVSRGSYGLLRESAWSFELAGEQDLLNLSVDNPKSCDAMTLEGWPMSFRVLLK